MPAETLLLPVPGTHCGVPSNSVQVLATRTASAHSGLSALREAKA
jgi:hypothetical protein